MQYWTEIRTALMVARLGTVTAAAEALGVHRATVNRHIDTLEATFATPLFQRHARGYSLTESGQDLLEIASRADEMFADLAGRRRGRKGQLSGALIITSLAGVAPLIMPALAEFHAAFPDIDLEFIAGAQLARLEFGEAHVAIRAGSKPDTADYVVQAFRSVRFGLYASRAYVERVGLPVAGQLRDHKFVGAVGKASPPPYVEWLNAHVSPAQLALNTSDQRVISCAVNEGLGLGFLAEHDARQHADLVEIMAPAEQWCAPLWLVTHVDLHRTAKVQEFLARVKAWRD